VLKEGLSQMASQVCKFDQILSFEKYGETL
jgi:hypothetical protein